jgi:hypothetical protein
VSNPDSSPRDIVGGTTRWRVFEVETAERPWAPAARTLVFMSPTAMRRVHSYPPHWRSLSDGELYALSWSA